MFGARQGFQKGIRNAFSFRNGGALAKLSTTQAKVGATSGNFPGASVGSAIYSYPTNSQIVRGTLPFTIEHWYYQTSANAGVYPSSVSNDWNAQASFQSPSWTVQPQRNGTRSCYWFMGTYSTAVAMLTSTSTPALNTWNHCAVVRTAASGCVLGTSTIAAGTGVLTVGTLTSGTISVGLYLTGTGVPAGTYITANISGSGAGSTWQTNTTTAVSSTTITGNNFNLYLNGTNESRLNSSVSLDNNTNRPLTLGTFGTSTVSNYIGYLDEFRFSSVARYFTTFTPQTTPFVDDADTLCLLHFDGANNSQVWPDDNT